MANIPDVLLCPSLGLADITHLQPQSGKGEAASLHHDLFQSYLPLNFVDPSANCKAAILILLLSPYLVDSIHHLGRRLALIFSFQLEVGEYYCWVRYSCLYLETGTLYR